MADLLTTSGVDLQWVRTGFLPGAFSLRWNDTEVGSLSWERLFSFSALARTPTGAWHIRRSGLRQLALIDAASGEQVGAMRLHLFGTGELTFADGRMLAMRRVGVFPPARSFQDGTGSDLVVVRAHFASLFRGGDCRIEPAATTLPEAGLVALLGVYILIREARRRARS